MLPSCFCADAPDTPDSATSLAVNTPGYQDAVDEARIAAEQIVIPRQQPIELLPRTQQLLDIQVCDILIMKHMKHLSCRHLTLLYDTRVLLSSLHAYMCYHAHSAGHSTSFHI